MIRIAREIVRLVQRRQRRQLLESFHRRGSMRVGAREFHAAVHDPVADRLRSPLPLTSFGPMRKISSTAPR